MRFFSKRILSVFILVVLVAGLYSAAGQLPQKSIQKPENPPEAVNAIPVSSKANSPSDIDPNARVTDNEQSHVLAAIGKTHDLSEVYLDKTYDGRLVISVTATLTDQETGDDKTLSNQIISSFIQKAYAIQPSIAGCMINVVRDDHLIAGASLGATAESKFATQTLTGKTSPAAVVAFLQEQNSETNDLTQNAWYYFSGE